MLEQFLAKLPFEPTGAQRRAIEEIRGDLSQPVPMVRLLQGDVGAGKTLIAAAAILLVVEKGADAALMAPTQILAEQHFRTFSGWFGPLGVNVRLLTGSRDEGGEMPLFQNQKSGNLTIGTHALFHGRADFENGLALAVIDEQHKFGVSQREALVSRGEGVSMLAMTATPIPRTLTLSFYGDLDVSILDELPAGRGKLITGIRLTTQTNQAATFVTEQLSAGRQAYVVYPLIEESDKLATGAATAAYAEWAEKLADFRVGLVHPKQEDARARLRILEETRDGFRIADEDLRLRGPGEVLGTMQSGLPDLAFADLLGDTRLVEEARMIAQGMLG